MNQRPTREQVEFLRRQYPAGTRITLHSMDDPQAPPPGTKGTVSYVDDMGTIGIEWDNGSALSLIPGENSFSKEAGRSIRSGEKGYTFFAEQEYTKEDGTIGNGYTITKAYDISQTRGPRPLPPQQHLPEEIIAAMVENSPVPLAISDQLPQGVQAQYVPKQHTIFVRNGMDETATICAIAREQAHANFDAVGSGYYRQAYAAQAYCAAYVAAQKFGLDASVFQFDKVCHSCAQLTPEEKRGFISDVKRAAYSINRDIQRSFWNLKVAIQSDEFSIESSKPEKASKSKSEKVPER